MKKEEEYDDENSYKKVVMDEDDHFMGVDDDSGVEARLMKCEDAGYTSSSNTSNSSSLMQQKDDSEWNYFHEEFPSSCNEDEFKRKQRKLFRQPSAASRTETVNTEGLELGSDCEPLLQRHRTTNEEEESIITQLQRNVLNNMNQVRNITTKVKKTSRLCEKEIKELKTFLLWLDKKNSDAVNSSATTKAELESRITNIEKTMKENRSSGKIDEGVEQVHESQQVFMDMKTNDLVDTVKRNTEDLSFLLSRFSLNDTTSSATSTASLYISQQMEVIEKRLTKMFSGLFLLLVLVNLLIFWINRDNR